MRHLCNGMKNRKKTKKKKKARERTEFTVRSWDFREDATCQWFRFI